MKKYLVLVLVVGTAFTAFTQTKKGSSLYISPAVTNQVTEAQTTSITGGEIHIATNSITGNQTLPLPAAPPPNETIIGGTTYDYQTNSSIARTLHFPPGGNYATVWTYSSDLGGGWPDRGTGYNYFSSGSQGTPPTSSIESPLRTGWPGLGHTTSGKEIAISHDPSAYVLIQNDRPVTGNGAWTPTTLTVLNPMGVWPRMAIGGSNGQTVHVIADTETGVPYNGMDPALLYARSTDGGVTWDILPMQLPGMDITNYLEISGDCYSIDARGDVVAIVEGSTAHDVALWKSLDNGTTWTRTIVQENTLAGPFDETTTLILQQDSIPSAGGAVHVLIDNNDVCHVFFDRIYLFNDVLNDQTYNLFMNGANFLNYWNENMGTQAPMEIGGALDTDGDNILDISQFGIPRYVNTNNLNSMPSAGIDQNGCIYLTYTAITEYNDGVNYYRHAYGTYSCDDGCSWSKPTRLTPGSLYGGTHDFDDCTFVTSAKSHGDSTYQWFQMDPEPGHSVGTSPEDQVGPNDIVFLAMDKNDYNDTMDVCLAIILGGDSVDCGDTIILSATCGTAYLWSTAATTQSITVITGGTYSVDITTPCGVLSDTVNVTLFAGPTPPTAVYTPPLTYDCGGTWVSYEWLMNGIPIVPPETNPTYICPNWSTCDGQNITCLVTDTNGCTVESNTLVGIDNNLTGGTAFEVYPNPNEGQFGLYFSNAMSDAYRIEVRNILGQEVFCNELQIAGNYTLNLDLRKLDKGVYFIKVSNSVGGSTEKIVIR